MAYNLGAASDTRTVNGVVCNLSTAKGQMLYLANTAYSALDSTVYGAWYQWGRQTDGHQKRNSTTVAIGTLLDGNYSNNNGTGQITHTTYKSQFITNSSSPYDWQKTHVDASDLWGNGYVTGYNFGSSADGAIEGQGSYSGQYFQSTSWSIPDNNPCPSGFRVPTQDEWERIGAYDCAPNSAAGSISDITAAGKSNGKGLTWVPVVCGIGSNITDVKCQAQSTWSTSSGSETRAGYAIYTTADWTANSSYTTDLTNPAAKEPLLFLPAAGYRLESGVLYNDNDGRYWSSTVISGGSHNLFFSRLVVHPFSDHGRAYGYSLRCVAE
jgi:hypothetical protein